MSLPLASETKTPAALLRTKSHLRIGYVRGICLPFRRKLEFLHGTEVLSATSGRHARKGRIQRASIDGSRGS
jgi:hypothetical protein